MNVLIMRRVDVKRLQQNYDSKTDELIKDVQITKKNWQFSLRKINTTMAQDNKRIH